jgi:hypothetical protein
MAYVIAEPCIATCDQACLDVCPTDCIHGPVPREEIEAMKDDCCFNLIELVNHSFLYCNLLDILSYWPQIKRNG